MRAASALRGAREQAGAEQTEHGREWAEQEGGAGPPGKEGRGRAVMLGCLVGLGFGSGLGFCFLLPFSFLTHSNYLNSNTSLNSNPMHSTKIKPCSIMNATTSLNLEKILITYETKLD